MKSSLLSAAKSLATGNRFRARASLAIAVIAAGTALTPSVSQAVIHWSGELNLQAVVISPPVITDLNGNGVLDPNEGIVEVVDLGRPGYAVSVRSIAVEEFAVSNIVPSGSVIDSNLSYLSGIIESPGPVGVRNIVPFWSGSENGPRFGWLEYSTSGSGDGTVVTLHQWAYNSTPNEPILAGAIPEPAHAALLTAAAALALGLTRRRKRQQA